MKSQLPQYLLCEDPTSENEDLFIYHVPSQSLVHIIHANAGVDDEIIYINSNYVDYTYTNNLGRSEKIMFMAELPNSNTVIDRSVLEQSAQWYVSYLGWEESCISIQQTKTI